MVAAAARRALLQSLRAPATDAHDGGVRVRGARLEGRHEGDGIGERVGEELAARALQGEEDPARPVTTAAANHQPTAARVAADVGEGLAVDGGIEEKQPR